MECQTFREVSNLPFSNGIGQSRRDHGVFLGQMIYFTVFQGYFGHKKNGVTMFFLPCLDLGSLAARTCKQRMGSTKLKSTWQCRSNLGSAVRAHGDFWKSFFNASFGSSSWVGCDSIVSDGAYIYIWYMYMCHGHNDISTYNYIYLFDMYLFNFIYVQPPWIVDNPLATWDTDNHISTERSLQPRSTPPPRQFHSSGTKPNPKKRQESKSSINICIYIYTNYRYRHRLIIRILQVYI